MNILLVIDSLAIGGAEVFIVRLANHLARRNHRVFILDINPAKRSQLITQRISDQVHLLTIDKSLSLYEKIQWKLIYTISRFSESWGNKAAFLRKRFEAKKLAKYLENVTQEQDIDVINSHLATADWMVAHYFASKNRKQKFIISMHGCYNQVDVETHPVKKLQYADRNWLLGLADYIVLLTPQNARPLINVPLRQDPVFIPLGFDSPPDQLPDAAAAKQTSSFTFGLVSRAIPKKGWEEAILATSLLNEERISCKLILVGGGEYQQMLQQRFGHLPYVHFVGASGQVTDWISQFDVGLLPSYVEYESFPNTVIEYLACGKPVIATNIGEVQNMISTPDGQLAGTLLTYLPEGISVTQLADRMRDYTQNRELLSRHTDLAPKAFEKFDMDRCVLSYEAIYNA